QIPTSRLKERIKQLCEQYGVKFTETEESYTSKSSFINDDFLPTFGEDNKPERWKPSGKRIKRGLYQTDCGFVCNSDCNGAANILRKVATTLKLNLSGVSRGSLSNPCRVLFWTKAKFPV
ncbi:MAG: zinc ribbon domain-containing protein, partial [Cyanobacteria bacterium J06639_18]